MAFQLAEAYVELSQRGFRGVTGAIDGIRSKLGGIVGFVTGPLGTALAGIGGGMAISGMVKLAAQAEQTEVQFRTLLGSAEEAKTMIEDLSTFSASTPFQMPQLTSAARLLLAFGTESQQIIPTMRVLGDVAAATGSDINELAQIFGKTQARGALMTEQLDQFNERGIPMGAKLGEMLGKTGDEIRDMAGKGEISFGDMQRAMISMTSEGGMAFNGMVSLSQTLGGVWSTFSDNMTLLMKDIGTAIVEGFDLTATTTTFTEFVQKARAEWIPSLRSAFETVKETIEPWKDTLYEAGLWVFDMVSDSGLYLELMQTMLANTMLNMAERVRVFYENSVTLAGWFYNSTLQFFTNLREGALIIYPAIYNEIARTFRNAYTMGEWYVSSMIQFFGNLYNKAGSIFSSLGEQIKNLWQNVLDFFSGRPVNFDFSPLKTAFDAAVEGIRPPDLEAPDTSAWTAALNAATQGIELPTLQTANLNQLQGDMDRIANQIAQRQLDREAERKKAADDSHENKIDQMKTEDSQDKKNDENKKKRAGAFLSFAALAEKMQAELFGDQKDKANPAALANAKADGQAVKVDINAPPAEQIRPVDAAQQQAANVAASNQAQMQQQIGVLNQIRSTMETLTNAATKDGIKMNQATTGVSLPAASVQFGASGA